MKHNTRNRFTGLLCAILALSMATTGLLAYFTDRVAAPSQDITMVEKGVDIVPVPDPTVDPDDPDKPNPDPDPDDPSVPPYEDPTDDNPDDDLTNLWAYSNAIAKVNYNPGDRMDLSYILKNQGDVAVKTRETFVISSDKELTAIEEFELFTAIAKGTEEGYENAWVGSALTGLTKTPIDSKHVKYTSTSDGSIAPGGTVNKKYYVVFDADSANTFQGVGVTIEYTVEAMQDNGVWGDAVSGTIKLGGTDYEVVPKYVKQ